jgi:hypothetical protein
VAIEASKIPPTSFPEEKKYPTIVKTLKMIAILQHAMTYLSFSLRAKLISFERNPDRLIRDRIIFAIQNFNIIHHRLTWILNQTTNCNTRECKYRNPAIEPIELRHD